MSVLVAKTHNDILATLITTRLGSIDDVSLVTPAAVGAEDIDNFCPPATAAAPDLFILVGFEKDLNEVAAGVLTKFPSSIVTRVIVGQGVAHLDWGPAKVDELVAVARSLSRRKSRSRKHDLVVRVEPADAPGADEIARSVRVFASIAGWLDAWLLAYLRTVGDSPGDMPGLAVSRSTVETLLTGGASVSPSAKDDRKAIDDAERRLARALESDAGHPFNLASRCLGLSPLECKVLLLCLAPELSVKYQRVFGFLNDDLSRRRPTLALLAAMFDDPLEARIALENCPAAVRWRLWDDGSHPLADEALRLDACMVAWLLGRGHPLAGDPVTASMAQVDPWHGAEDASEGGERLAELLQDSNGARWIVLEARDEARAGAALAAATRGTGKPLLRITPREAGQGERDEGALLPGRIAWITRVLGAIPVLVATSLEEGNAPAARIRPFIELLDDSPSPRVVISSSVADVIEALPGDGLAVVRLGDADEKSARAALEAGSQASGLDIPPAELALLANAYPLPSAALEKALRLARAEGASAGMPPDEQAARLSLALQTVASPTLPKLATRLAPSFNLTSVVLPESQREQLNAIVSHVVHAQRVLGDWGFAADMPYGRGVCALFVGPSGCGKTMAARAIGHALRRWVYAVDISRVVSKYIGETEKQLDAAFVEAERSGAILLFDEAESLFSARGNVNSANDHYANLKTAYLLQRIENFSGLAILTSNLGRHIDPAFTRRLRFIVDFPFPDAAARERIWRQCLPAAAPVAEDVDLGFIARRAELSGGSIRQITLGAAYKAAAENSSIHMRHILEAARAEAGKMGMPRLERELGGIAA